MNFFRKLFVCSSFLGVLIVSFLLSSCTQSTKNSVNNNDAQTKPARVLHFACWGNTVSPALLEEFKKNTGIEVQLSLYASNEELLAKLQAGASGYDLVVPSDYMVSIMTALHLLHPIDHAKIKNFQKIDSRFLKRKFDLKNEFSVPLDWGTSGIAINRSKTQKKIKSWKDVFDDPELRGKFSLLDDVRETLGLALKLNGYSLNSRSELELKTAQETLLKIKPFVKAFISEPLSGMVAGEFVVSHMYSSDAYQAKQKLQGQLEYVLPEEGGVMWIDSLVIPKGAKHIEEAHLLMDYLISSTVERINFERLFVAPVHQDIFLQLPDVYRNDRSLFPTDWKKLENIEELDESMRLWDRAWTEIKVQS